MKVIVLLSGGLDSTTLLFHHIRMRDDVIALSVDYGQRHLRELSAAADIAREVRVDHRVLRLSWAMEVIFRNSQSSQIRGDIDVPHGHYADEMMKTTIVPNRNMLLLSLAGALAESENANLVSYAAHSGDHAVYPDCRPEFYESCAMTLLRATDNRVNLTDPFINHTKTDIVRYAAEMNVPFALTYSCYEGDVDHCGKCGTCVERREAFFDAVVADLTKYKA